MGVYSTCHGLHLAAVHAQGKWVNHFQHALELREGVKPSHTRIGSGQVTHRPGMTQEEAHNWYRWAQVILNAMIYSAVIVNVEDADSSKRFIETIWEKQVEPDNGFKKFIFFCCMLHYTNTFCYVQIS